MRTGQWRRSLTLLVTAAALAGCNSAEPQPNPTVSGPTSSPATETPTPTNSPSDPYAVPDEITPGYVDLVVNRIYENYGELLRQLLGDEPDPAGTMALETREDFSAIFDGEYLQQRLDSGDGIAQGDRPGYLAPGDLTQIAVETRKLVAASPSCIVAVADMDTTGVAENGFTELVALALESSDTKSSQNPTGWKLTDIAPNRNSQGEPNDDGVMLDASLDDLTAVAIDTTCSTEDEL